MNEEKKKLCEGCRDDFYNGKNPLGVEECWNFPTATIVERKKVGFWDEPPWESQPIVTCLDCRSEKEFVFVEPHRKH